MILSHGASWFNPFDVDGRYLKNIHFYTPGGIKLSSGHGWLDKTDSRGSNNEFGNLIVPGEIVYKRAPIDFKKAKGVFLVKVKPAYYEKGKERYSELYIPFDVKEWDVKEVQENYNPESIYVYDQYSHKNGYSIKLHKEHIPKADNIAFIADINRLAELTCYKPDTNGYSIMKNEKAIKSLLKELSDKYSGD